ncbi:MAG: hypothetical protein KBC43_06560 [Bacteroidales bacterium]|nr:hypothetical protein [Bacteroidales bacterium]
MPKHDIILKPAEKLPKNLEVFVKETFRTSDLEKLQKFGGRIQVSITAPFTDRKSQNKELNIDQKFINDLISKPASASNQLKHLTKDQLSQVAQKLKLSISSKMTIREVRNSIIDFVNSSRVWSAISGSNKSKTNEKKYP